MIANLNNRTAMFFIIFLLVVPIVSNKTKAEDTSIYQHFLKNHTTDERAKEVLGAVSDVVAGRYHTLFILNNGRVVSTKRRAYGTEQLPIDGFPFIEKVMDAPFENAVAGWAGDNNALIMDKENHFYFLGDSGEYGYAVSPQKNLYYSEITPISSFRNVKKILFHGSNVLIINADDSLWGIGLNKYGQLGVGSSDNVINQFVEVARQVKSVWSDGKHLIYRKKNNELFSLGSNEFGELGLGSAKKIITTPQKVNISPESVEQIKEVYFGDRFTFVLLQHGNVLFAGDPGMVGDMEHKLGMDSAVSKFTLTPIKNVYRMAVGMNHALFLKADLTLWSSGSNTVGELGIGQHQSTSLLDLNYVGKNIKKIWATYRQSFVLDTNGIVYASGNNQDGVLGVGGVKNQFSFTPVMLPQHNQ